MDLILAITYGIVKGFSQGTTVANIVATLSGPPGLTIAPQTVAPGTASIDFGPQPAGDYAYSVYAIDASGATLGTPATGTVTLDATGNITIGLSLPVSVTAQTAPTAAPAAD